MSGAVLKSGLSRDVFPINEVRQTKLGEPSAEAKDRFPYYWTLPTDPVESLRFRLYVKERCLEDTDFRAAIIEMCEHDVAFFGQVLGWVFEPRPNPRKLPIFWWLDQVDMLAWADECFGKRDLGEEKSRGIGASWMWALFYYHKWRFCEEVKLAMISKDETSLDGPDSNSLMGKVKFIHDHMPAWLRLSSTGQDIMHRVKDEHTMFNRQLGGMLQGFVPTDQKVRSLRFTSMFYDEFGFLPGNVQANLNSSGGTCPNRNFVSTWNGPNNEFHKIMRRDKSTLLRCEVYWWNNTERYQGAYTTENGRLKILDEGYQYPKNYPFELDGLMRSPWIDFELRRAGANVSSALEEYYGLQAEDKRKLFRATTIDVIKTTARVPDKTYRLERVDGQMTLVEDRTGDVWVWGDIGDGRAGPFSMGCDIGFGRGTTFSTAEVVDLSTGEQVLEFAVDDLNPVAFAQAVVDIANWLNGRKGDGHTFVTFENNGDQGKSFGQETTRLGYGNIERRRYKGRSPDNETHYLGTRNTDKGLAALSELERAVMTGECILRSGKLHMECSEFVRDDRGRPLYPTSAEGHGDRAQGMGLAWAQARGRLIEDPVEKQKDARAEIMGEIMEDEADVSWSEQWTLKRKLMRL